MTIASVASQVDASHVQLESLANNQALTQDQKIGEASRQFEAVLLRQFLSEAQKPVISSEFTDDSSTAGIYQDMVTNQLADLLSRHGGIGLAKTFERQLAPQAAPLENFPPAATSARGVHAAAALEHASATALSTPLANVAMKRPQGRAPGASPLPLKPASSQAGRNNISQ